jgi:class 3 adenylate cyclase/tetratricopeptide (TPR) repeat protein
VPTGPTDAGERRHLTALFCDLVGSTAIASRLDPEEWHRISKAYQEAAAAAVTGFGGHVDKFLGEGLVCFFGVPEAHEDDAERAVRAGLAIVDAVQRLNRNAAAPEAHLRARIGIHTGSAVVGPGGGHSKDVFGDTPNIAARVQSVAEADSVLITSATQRLVAGVFVVEERGAHQLKGVPQPVVLYRVVQPSGVRSRLAVAAGRLTRFVGRQSELGVLADAWERVLDGTGQTVLVCGEPGVGKSRLVYELRERLGAAPHTWLECRCSAYTQGTAFQPLIELVTQGVRLEPSDTPAEKLGKLEQALRRADFPLSEMVPLFADFLSIPLGSYGPLDLHPDVQRRKTLAALTAWNLRLGTLQPLIMLMEDLHWCDPSSLELIERLVRQSPTARVLLICTARPEFQSPWGTRSNLAAMTLVRLTRRQAREMVAALGPTLPATAMDAIVARADGVPLYIEELTKAALESKTPGGDVVTPDTLQDSLMARLDRLSAVKEVALRASVLGREFSYGLLAASSGLDEGSLVHSLARLVESELLFVRGTPPQATYIFKHGLIQETAYQSLLKRTRQELHARVARALEEYFPEQAAAEPEVVARHCEAGGLTNEAITYYQRAGAVAQARSAHEEAIGQLDKAIALLEARPTGPERNACELTLQLALGASLIAVRGWSHEKTGATWERAAALAETADEAGRRGMARGGLGLFHVNRGEIEQGRVLFADVLAAAEGRGDTEQTFLGHVLLAAAEFYLAKFASSLAHCDRALILSDSVPHERLAQLFGADPAAGMEVHAALAHWFLGHFDTALRHARQAVAIARRLGDPFSLAFALFFESYIHWLRRDPGLQRECAMEAIALSEAQGFPVYLGLGRAMHAMARVTDGEPGALADIMDGLALAAGTGNQTGAPGFMLLVAGAQQVAGEPAAAKITVATGLAVAAQTGQPGWDADLHRLDGELLLALGGAADEAAACYTRALDIAREYGARSYELRAATSLARLWRDQGNRAEARDLLTAVYERFTEGFDTRDLQDAKTLLDEL